VLGVFAAFLLLSLALVLLLWRQGSVSVGPLSVFRLRLDTPASVFGSPIILSPDGKQFAMVETSGGVARLWVRSLDQLSGHVLLGTEGVESPFWSPGSDFIGFFADGKLKRVDLYGAPPRIVCDAPGIAAGGSWSIRNVILFGSERGLLSVSAAGGSPQPVTELDKSRNETSHVQPFFMPDGRHFLFLARSANSENNAIFVGELGKPTKKFVVNSEVQALFAPPDHLIYLRGTALMRQSFDPRSLEIDGEPTKIADEIILGPGNSYATFSVSLTGHMVYRTGSDVVLERQVGFVDRGGSQIGTTLATGAGNYMNPVFSPRGDAIALHRRELGSDIWIYDESGRGSN
jgi:Tol biopolymer transport system component